MIYLKTTKHNTKISTASKITEKGILYVTQSSIEIDALSLDTLEDERKWYIEKLGAETATQQEFDQFYIDAVRNINEISKL
jgi:uncharacterized membrane protein